MRATVDFEQMDTVIDTLVNHCHQSFYMDAKLAKRFLPELAGKDPPVKDEDDQPSLPPPQRPRFAA